MADVFTKQKRSEIMARIKSKDTETEKIVFSYLKKNKVYFQKHYKKAAGCPDIALPRRRKAVFIDGDFWHGYQFNKWKNRVPKKYWLRKIECNMKRDRKKRRILKNEGWDILRVWEHEVKRKSSRDVALEKIKLFLCN